MNWKFCLVICSCALTWPQVSILWDNFNGETWCSSSTLSKIHLSVLGLTKVTLYVFYVFLILIFSPQTVGVIVRLERDNFHVLSMHDKVVQAKPQALQKKKELRRAVALDSDENNIQVKDIVDVIDGLHSVCICLISCSLRPVR